MKPILLLIKNEIQDNLIILVLASILNFIFIIVLGIYLKDIILLFGLNISITMNFTYLNSYMSIQSDREDSIYFSLKALPVNAKQYYFSKILYNLFFSTVVFFTGLFALLCIGKFEELFKINQLILLLVIFLVSIISLISIFINFCNQYIIPMLVFLIFLFGYFFIEKIYTTKIGLIILLNKIIVFLNSGFFVYTLVGVGIILWWILYLLFTKIISYKYLK